MANKRRTLDQTEKDQIVNLNMLGQTAKEIAKGKNWSLTAIQDAIAEAKEDAQAGDRALQQAKLASAMHEKIQLLITHITPEAIAEAISAGKLKDVAQSIGILADREKAILDDLHERLGADHLRDAGSVGDLMSDIQRGMGAVEKTIKRIQAKEASMEVIPKNGQAS